MFRLEKKKKESEAVYATTHTHIYAYILKRSKSIVDPYTCRSNKLTMGQSRVNLGFSSRKGIVFNSKRKLIKCRPHNNKTF